MDNQIIIKRQKIILLVLLLCFISLAYFGCNTYQKQEETYKPYQTITYYPTNYKENSEMDKKLELKHLNNDISTFGLLEVTIQISYIVNTQYTSSNIPTSIYLSDFTLYPKVETNVYETYMLQAGSKDKIDSIKISQNETIYICIGIKFSSKIKLNNEYSIKFANLQL